MDHWYSYTLYAANPPKAITYTKSEQLPPTSELSSPLRRGPGSQRSSGSSDTDSKLGSSSPRSERFRRFTFSGRRKKQLNRPAASSFDNPKDVAQVFKAIAYSSYQQPIPQTIDSQSLQRHERELSRHLRRHSDSSFKSAHTYRQEQFQTPMVQPQEQYHPSQSLKNSLYLHTSSNILTNVEPALPYEWCGGTLKPSSFLIEKTPRGENRFSPTPRPLSSGSNTLGELEDIHMERKFPSGFLINPFRIKHNRPRIDQDEHESWEEAVDWWYEYGEDESM